MCRHQWLNCLVANDRRSTKRGQLIMDSSYDFFRIGGLSALIDWLFGGA